MEAKPNIKRRGYKLIHRKGLELISDYLPDYEIAPPLLNKIEFCSTEDDDEYKIEFKIVTENTVDYYFTALEILRRGQKLSLLLWEDFENFIAEWLLQKGWCVSQTNRSQNGGINITTTRFDRELGWFKYIWITKKYSLRRSVGIKTIRELSYLISHTKASKGVIVTTSRLTGRALKMIEENKFNMFYINNEMLEKEFQQNSKSTKDEISDLPF